MDELKDTTPEHNEENNEELQDQAEETTSEITLEQVYSELKNFSGRIDNLEKQFMELSPVAEESTEESTEESSEESSEVSEDELKAVDALLQNK